MANPAPRRAIGEPHRRVRLHPDDERAAVEAIRRAAEHPEELLTVTADDLERWAQTGEWPESSG